MADSRANGGNEDEPWNICSCQDVRKYSKKKKNDEDMSKGHRNQLRGAPTHQTWDNLFNHETKTRKGQH